MNKKPSQLGIDRWDPANNLLIEDGIFFLSIGLDHRWVING